MRCFALLALVCAAAAPAWNKVEFGKKTLLLHPKCEPLPATLLGPFAKRSDGAVLAVDDQRVMVSKDEGKTWTPRPLFADTNKFQCRGERALLRTREGTMILAFLNVKEMVLRWNQAKGGPQPGMRIPVYVTRSSDDGETWEEPRMLQDGYCGALRTMIQLRSGRVVLGCQVAVSDPGRHVCFSYASDDEGRTWKKSNVIDLGKYGGYGDHGGGIEPTLAQLHDGRLWMLIRTYRGCFTEAYSSDEGLTWTDIKPGKIEASGSPGQLLRLQSGRLALFWNRYIDKEKKTGRREQLSMAFTEDDGRTWTGPVVVAYDPMQPGDKEPDHRLSYPYVYEHVPGELWITTFQGPLRMKLREDDFLPRRLSEQTYRARWLPAATIKLDGKADEPAWAEAGVEKHFIFPWKKTEAPATEFPALCDGKHLYFTFRVHDEDIVALDKLRDEQDAMFEDRVELYFSRDEQMKDYYCAEVDSRGRAFDYRGAYYRQLDMGWNFKGLEAKASPLPQGYVVEGRIPLASFEAMGFPRLKPGVKIRCGLYRAEFSHDRSGRPVVQRPSIHNRGRQLDGPPPLQEWMSWVDPKTEEPDFHVPTSLGWLEIVK
ncbi:MAG: exo-alpha-sialidase [Verrucomicrobia bacterium]|nr:exo-alpha-sialidase [Verrucomicrobiota bacterium]